MGKYANKPQGKPTKRKTLKVKYKIERKVKQHNKRVRKEAIKLKAKGLLRSRDTGKDDFLPNMYPYKMQLLDEQKRGMPQSKVIETNVLEQTPLRTHQHRKQVRLPPQAQGQPHQEVRHQP